MRCSNADGPPACWARFRNDQDCQACPWADGCRRSAKAERRPTVTELLQGGKTAAASADPEDLLDYARERMIEVGARMYGRAKDLQYLQAMRTVVACCGASDVDPRAYIRAQAEILGRSFAVKGYAISPGCFHGANADKRYQDWWARHKRKVGVVDAARVDKDERLRAANVFAEQYFDGARKADAVAAARELLPEWDPDMMEPRERVAALSHALFRLDPSLPDRVCPPAEWTWAQARRFLTRISESDSQEEAVSLPDSLGEVV